MEAENTHKDTIPLNHCIHTHLGRISSIVQTTFKGCFSTLKNDSLLTGGEMRSLDTEANTGPARNQVPSAFSKAAKLKYKSQKKKKPSMHCKGGLHPTLSVSIIDLSSLIYLFFFPLSRAYINKIFIYSQRKSFSSTNHQFIFSFILSIFIFMQSELVRTLLISCGKHM